MADFCKTCSIANFGEDHGDLAKLLPPENYTATAGVLALCECCGPIVVDYEGVSMSSDFIDICGCQAERLKTKDSNVQIN